MSLSLYNHYGDSYTNVFCWYPNEEQWWVTGFNAHSEFCEPHPEDMIAIGSIDFSANINLYNSFKTREIDENLASLKNYFYFDDEKHIIWIIFTESDGREYNFALK